MMELTKKNAEATDSDVIEVLTAISVVSKRLANNLMAVRQQNNSEEGVNDYEQNQVAVGCNRRCAFCSR